MPDIGQRIEFAHGGEQVRAHAGRVFDQCEHFCFTGEKFPGVFFGQRDHITRQHIHSATVDVTTGAKNPAIGTGPIADGDFNTCVEAERLVMDKGTPARFTGNTPNLVIAIDIHQFKDGLVVKTWHVESWLGGLSMGAFE